MEIERRDKKLGRPGRGKIPGTRSATKEIEEFSGAVRVGSPETNSRGGVSG